MSHMKKSKLITAILPKGISLDIVRRLKKEKDVTTANFFYARGIGKIMTDKRRLGGEEREREILSVVVDEDRGDEIYEYVYHAADMNKPHGGTMYMKTILASDYILPENVTDER